MAFSLIHSFILKTSYDTQTPIDEAAVEKKFGKRILEELKFFNYSYEEYCQKLYLSTGIRYCLDFEYPKVEYQGDHLGWVPVSSEVYPFTTIQD
jgi:hypothetical protein